MNNFYKLLNVLFIGGLLGAAVMTWFAPKAIEMFLTPPVSFGVNCEPAAVYSMQKLVLCQIIGLVFGAMLFLIIKIKFFAGKAKAKEVTNGTDSQGPTSI